MREEPPWTVRYEHKGRGTKLNNADRVRLGFRTAMVATSSTGPLEMATRFGLSVRPFASQRTPQTNPPCTAIRYSTGQTSSHSGLVDFPQSE